MSPIPADHSLLYFSSGTDFLLLPKRYGALYGVLFYDGKKDVPLDVTVNYILLLEALLPNVTYCCGIINTVELVVCLLDAHKLFIYLFNKTNRSNN